MTTDLNEEKSTIVEFELVEDLQEHIAVSSDVKVEPELKQEINKFPEGTLVKVVKEIGSYTKIISVQEATEKLIETEIW